MLHVPHTRLILAQSAKEAVGISALSLPPRSPDLNPLDFSIRAEVNKRMRAQEAKWPSAKKETRDQYLARLRRTALGLPRSYIDKVFGNIAHRLRLVKDAKGGHFPEGGF